MNKPNNPYKVSNGDRILTYEMDEYLCPSWTTLLSLGVDDPPAMRNIVQCGIPILLRSNGISSRSSSFPRVVSNSLSSAAAGA